MSHRRTVTDRQVELWIARLLRFGVIAAALLGTAGGIVHLAGHAQDVPSYVKFKGEPSALRHVRAVVDGALALQTEALIQAGLLLLIAVPILRVAVSVVAFALERDWRYVLVTVLVMGILLFSFLGGLKA
jgi:uncharacterized membrane protein